MAMIVANPTGLRTVRRELQIDQPIHLSVVDTLEGWGTPQPDITWALYKGNYQGFHKIVIRDDGQIDKMSVSFLHECIHALQVQLLGSFDRFIAEIDRQRAEIGYDGTLEKYKQVPFEAMAYELSEALGRNPDLPTMFHEAGMFCPTELLRFLMID